MTAEFPAPIGAAPGAAAAPAPSEVAPGRRRRGLDALASHAGAIALLVLGAGLAATYGFWRQVHADAQRIRAAAFEHAANESVDHVQARLQRHAQLLRGAVGLVAASRQVRRREFHAFVASQRLWEQFPEIVAVGLAIPDPALPGAARIVYREGPRESADADGDIKDPIRRNAMQRARTSGAIAVSAAFAGSPGGAAHVALFEPFVAATDLDASRHARAPVAGWIFSEISVPALMGKLLEGELRQNATRARIALRDEGADAPAPLLYRSGPAPAARPALSASRLVHVGGRGWTLELQALPGFRVGREDQDPGLLAAAGVATSALFAGIAWLLATGRQRARSAAARMNADLVDSESRLRELNATLERRVAERTRELEAGAERLGRAIEESRHAEESQRLLAQELREAWHRLTHVEEADRRWLAGELHDSVGAALTALNLNLTILDERLPAQARTELGPRLQDSVGLLEETVDAVRGLMAQLRPPVLDDYGVATALRWYVDQVCARSGIDGSFRLAGSERRFPPDVEIALFRIVQGALTNVVRHAQARIVRVSMDTTASPLTIVVADDGRGFVPEETRADLGSPHWGLVTMRERAQAIGARCTIESSPGAGTRVTVELAA